MKSKPATNQSADRLFIETALNYQRYGTSYPQHQAEVVTQLEQYISDRYPDDCRLRSLINDLKAS